MLAIYMKCPSCGAELEYQVDKEMVYCSFCGTKMLLKEQKEEHIFRTVDEALLQEIEYQKYLIEERKKAKAIRKRKKAKVSLVLLIITVFCLITGFTGTSHANSAGGRFMTLFGILAFIGIFSGIVLFLAVLSWVSESLDDDDVLSNKVTRIHRRH